MLFAFTLGQQEEEYEDELRQLIAAAENELVGGSFLIYVLSTLYNTAKISILICICY